MSGEGRYGGAVKSFHSLVIIPVLLIACTDVPEPVVVKPPLSALDTYCPVGTSSLLDQARERQSLRVVALGSSTTSGQGASALEFNYVSRLTATLKATLPQVDVQVRNAGVGGETLQNMSARLERDVYSFKPDVVIVQTGAIDSTAKVAPDVFRAELMTVLNELKSRHIAAALMGTQFTNGAYAFEPYEVVMREVTRMADVPFVDRYRYFKSLVDEGHPLERYVSSDRLHHTDEGYRIVSLCTARVVFAIRE